MARDERRRDAEEGFWRCADCGSPQSLKLRCCLECGGSFMHSLERHAPRKAHRQAVLGALMLLALWLAISAWLAAAWR